MKHVKISVFIIFILGLTLTACGGKLSIEDPWTRPALIDGNGAAYVSSRTILAATRSSWAH